MRKCRGKWGPKVINLKVKNFAICSGTLKQVDVFPCSHNYIIVKPSSPTGNYIYYCIIIPPVTDEQLLNTNLYILQNLFSFMKHKANNSILAQSFEIPVQNLDFLFQCYITMQTVIVNCTYCNIIQI